MQDKTELVICELTCGLDGGYYLSTAGIQVRFTTICQIWHNVMKVIVKMQYIYIYIYIPSARILLPGLLISIEIVLLSRAIETALLIKDHVSEVHCKSM